MISSSTISWLNRVSIRVLKGDMRATRLFEKRNILWRVSHADPKTGEVHLNPPSFSFSNKIKEFEPDPLRRGVIWNTEIHLSMNSEHITPLPILITILREANHILIQSRDLGPGLGEYLNNIGYSFSTRPWEKQIQFGLDDQGNGILFTLNQVLNGCLGKVVIDSMGQKIILEKRQNKIYGRRAPSLLVGTRFLLFLPLTQNWTQEPTGWDPYEHVSFDITWIKK